MQHVYVKWTVFDQFQEITDGRAGHIYESIAAKITDGV